MDQICVDCVAELDHCHGTLVHHYGYLLECSEPGCPELDASRHLWIVDCELVDRDCACGAEVSTALRLAS